MKVVAKESIVIEATPEEVWTALSDLEADGFVESEMRSLGCGGC